KLARSSSASADKLKTVPDIMRAMVMRALLSGTARAAPQSSRAQVSYHDLPNQVVAPLRKGWYVGRGRGARFRRLLCQLRPAGGVSTSSGCGSGDYAIT